MVINDKICASSIEPYSTPLSTKRLVQRFYGNVSNNRDRSFHDINCAHQMMMLQSLIRYLPRVVDTSMFNKSRVSQLLHEKHTIGCMAVTAVELYAMLRNGQFTTKCSVWWPSIAIVQLHKTAQLNVSHQWSWQVYGLHLQLDVKLRQHCSVSNKYFDLKASINQVNHCESRLHNTWMWASYCAMKIYVTWWYFAVYPSGSVVTQSNWIAAFIWNCWMMNYSIQECCMRLSPIWITAFY